MPNEIPSIDPRPEWLRRHQVDNTGANRLLVDQRDYLYTLVPHGVFHPELPYAVGAESMTEVYISDNVPVIDRALILSHEIREKSRFRLLPAEERCTAALAAELSEVQLTRKPQDYKKYVERRMDYFNAALRHYQRTAMETPQFMDGLLTATTYINHIAAGLGKKPKR